VTRSMDTLTYERTTRTYDARHLLGIAVACGFIGGCGNSDHTARDRVIADFAATLTTAGPFALREPPGGRRGADGISAATGFVPSARRVNLIDHHFLPWSFEPLGAANLTAVSTSIVVFLCPSDTDLITDDGQMGHNSYRACAGTKPW
jgi:hypothetical protein